MKLTILGCSGSVPAPGQAASGYLVESGDTRIVLDLGNGVLGALQRFVDPFAIDALLLSHLHPDHCADVTALTVLRRYDPNPPYDPTVYPLQVLAPAEAPSRLAAMYAPSAAELVKTDLSDVFVFSPLSERPLRIGPFEVSAAPMAHVCPSWGFRLAAEGRVLVYSGDTGPCLALTELAHGADVLLSEASWPDSPNAPADVHLSGRQAARTATDAGVRRLLLTHVQPWWESTTILDEARRAFDGPVEVVEEGRCYEV